mmetsp:Transcript_38352/g.62131  ORF Transcript_38352/g.62131 Transcript_38352/m.62131 type:complete len:81 (-) Transcript_38352:248-490(-)
MHITPKTASHKLVRIILAFRNLSLLATSGGTEERANCIVNGTQTIIESKVTPKRTDVLIGETNAQLYSTSFALVTAIAIP